MALQPRQQHVLIIAMQVRNALEEFHIANLSDAQMKVLNQTIRYAIDNAVELTETLDSNATKQRGYAWLVEMIPDYWEIPGRDARPGSDISGE